MTAVGPGVTFRRAAVLSQVMGVEARLVPDSQRHSRAATASWFERFFRDQYPGVVRIAYGVVGDLDTAQDVAQDVLIAAQARFPRPDAADHAAAWVRVAAAHAGLNAIRSQRRRDHRHRRYPLAVAPPGPEEVVIARESQLEVRQALGRLPTRAATVLLLRHSGLRYAEVGEIMDVKAGQVGTMLRRAESALRKEMERAPRP